MPNSIFFMWVFVVAEFAVLYLFYLHPYFFKAKVPWITLKGDPILFDPKMPGMFGVVDKVKEYPDQKIDLITHNEHGWLPVKRYGRGEVELKRTNPPLYIDMRNLSEFVKTELTQRVHDLEAELSSAAQERDTWETKYKELENDVDGRVRMRVEDVERLAKAQGQKMPFKK